MALTDRSVFFWEGSLLHRIEKETLASMPLGPFVEPSTTRAFVANSSHAYWHTKDGQVLRVNDSGQLELVVELSNLEEMVVDEAFVYWTFDNQVFRLALQ
jgi:hypothetical protein